jgi:hypothetical protein
MGQELPPALDRLGEHLVAAADRVVAARRRRTELARRLAATCAAALLALAALLPAELGPAGRAPESFTGLLARAAPPIRAACDLPPGRRGALPACRAGEPPPLGRPHRG